MTKSPERMTVKKLAKCRRDRRVAEVAPQHLADDGEHGGGADDRHPEPLSRGGIFRQPGLRARAPELEPDSASVLQPRAREAGFFGARDGRASINFRVLYQLIKA